ncbi:MAG: glycosyltransferase family 4 protein [Planctomycetaceae bacterium]|jgi:glycosyltransferase involved in cell wall biosynthesis|nr:glycosyltransferase family 4 protein [Planctomycetaceae bacterium]
MKNYRVLVPVSHPLGGIRTYMLYYFRRLHKEAGYRFTFLSEAGNAFDTFKRDLTDWEDTEFIEIPPKSGSKTVFQIIRQTLKTQPFTLIHSQGLKAGTETAAANYFRNIPHLITLHDVILPQNEIPGRFKWLKKTIISLITRRASFIIPVSHDCETNHLQIFPAWQHGPVQIKTILNGIDIERIENSRSIFETCRKIHLREQFGIGHNVILGGFFGRFMPQKGIDILLKALALLADQGYAERFRLVVTKDPNGFLNETIRLATENPKIAPMIYFIDSVSDITPLLLQIDATIIPSRWEACPILPMESLVLGVPVVGSNCIGLREVLHGTPSLIHQHDNPESLAAMLIKFIESPTTDAVKRYAADAVKRFDIRSATNQLLEIYQSFSNNH